MTKFILIVLGQMAARLDMSLLDARDKTKSSVIFDKACPLERTVPLDEALCLK